MLTKGYDRDLIREIEQQGDWDAQVEAELDRLQALPLQELIDELTGGEWMRYEQHTREYIIDTFGTRIATDRIHGRNY